MAKYILWEWDMDNGEYLYKEEFEAKDEEEARRYLESIVSDAESEDWDCYEDANGYYICSKKDEEGYVIQRQIGIDILD